MASKKYIQSIARAVDMLEVIGNAPCGLTPTTVAKVCQMPKQTAHTILRTLLHKGLLEKRTSPVRYMLAPVMDGLRKHQDRWNHQVLLRAAPVLVRIWKKTGAEMVVAQYAGGEVLARMVVPWPADGQMVRYSWRLDSHCTGLVFQAFMDESELRDYRAKYPLIEWHAEFWKSFELLDNFLSLVRREGYLAYVQGGIFRAAAPVFDRSQTIKAAIRASKPIENIKQGDPRKCIDLVRQAAGELSLALRQDVNLDPSAKNKDFPANRSGRTRRGE